MERTPSYHAGDPEKQRKAQERAQAIREGRLPAWEAQQRTKETREPEAVPGRPDYRTGDPKKLAEAQERLQALYPKKKEDGEAEKAA